MSHQIGTKVFSCKESHLRYTGKHVVSVAVAVQTIPCLEVEYSVENCLLTKKLPRIDGFWE